MKLRTTSENFIFPSCGTVVLITRKVQIVCGTGRCEVYFNIDSSSGMKGKRRQMVDQRETPMRNHQQNASKKMTPQIQMKVINNRKGFGGAYVRCCHTR